MAQPITWGAYLFAPLEHLMAEYGIDPHAGIDALVVSVILILFAFIAGRKFRKTEMLEPEGRISLAFVAEWIVGGLMNLFNGIIHHGARNVFFVLGTFSFFILGNNLIGLVPGFNPPTDQFNVTFALAIITFITAHTIGIREHGFAYIKKFMGPLWWLSPLLFPIELVSHMVRPLSLSIRLFGNMTGDHKVVLVFSSLLALGLPIPFMGLGIFISFLQTFVFILLSAVYFQDALDHPH
ncbi:MAG: F0F1 ATP synthase subunit A [Deltaproteobacteria bacterium]|nr:F0F1 ATP synthase subunit A [Deltaproteobacteria bacterium]